MANVGRRTLYLFCTSEELQSELIGEWECSETTCLLRQDGKARITWYKSTGALLFQGPPHISKGLYEAVQEGIVLQDKFKFRTKSYLEHNQL